MIMECNHRFDTFTETPSLLGVLDLITASQPRGLHVLDLWRALHLGSFDKLTIRPRNLEIGDW
jgi:hypothetical protein